jgi:hypothetical protein
MTFDGDPFAYYATLADVKVPAEHVYRDRVLPGMLIPSGTVWQMIGSPTPGPMGRELVRIFELVAVADPPRTKPPAATEGAGPDPSPPTAPSEKAVLEIEYASVYGERWRIRSDGVVPERL